MKPLPRGMVQERAHVLLHRRIAADHHLLRIHSPRAARRAEPGQFIHILCGESGPGTAGRGQSPSGTAPFLRRPLSLFDADPVRGFIEVIYKVVGLGTASLARVPVGARVDFLGPLGRPFLPPEGGETLFLVGGGVGIPPLYFLAKKLKGSDPLKRGQTPVGLEVFLGARTRGWVICASAFSRLGIRVGVATDDGSWGWRGSVVDLLRRRLRARGRNGSVALCVCGPTPMMAAAAALARQARMPAQVSLEERMGCAMGCCMGCVVEMATQPKNSHARFQRVCTEGPVFDAREILWRNPRGV